jgi:hemolysin activation/secretion protein
MKPLIVQPPCRLALGWLLLTLAATFSCQQATAQSVRPGRNSEPGDRFPKINADSPLLAISGAEDGKEKKAEITQADAAKPNTSAPAIEKPKMKEPSPDAVVPPSEAPKMRVPEDNASRNSGLLPATNVSKPIPLNPEKSNLVPLKPEAPSAVEEVVALDPNLPIIAHLKGITLFKDDRKGVNDAPSSVPSSTVPGVQIAPDLNPPAREVLVANLQREFLGKPISFSGLDKIVKAILSHYSGRQRPTTHVYIPEQEIGGVVKIAVLEGRLGQVRVAGEDQKRSWFHPRSLRVPQALDDLKGDVLDMNTITRAISELNISPWSRLGRQDAHPYRRATVGLKPGSELGLTDMDLAVNTRKIVPIQTFAGWDNTGTVVLGENRFNVGAVWYDAFNTGYNHQMGFQAQSAETYDLFHALIGSYEIPIPSLNSRLQFFGAFMQSSVNVPTAGVSQLIKGDAWTVGSRWYYRLPNWYMTKEAKLAADKTRQLAIYHEFGFGLDYKSQQNNLFFGGVNVFPSQIEVFQYVAEYNLRQTDKWGETTLNLACYYAPGKVTRDNSDAKFAAARSGGRADYAYLRGSFSRLVDLGTISSYLNDMKFVVRGTGQWSNSNLVASEQMGLGGQDSVRGYPVRTMRGDAGLFLQTEVYFPAIHPLRWLAQRTPDRWVDTQDRTDELRFLLFYDYGYATTVHHTAAEPGIGLNAASLGFGLRYRFNKSMLFRFDYGFQLDKLNPARVNAADLSPKYSNSGHGYAHMGLTLSF